MTEEEIWQIVAYIRSLEVKAADKSSGNTALGKKLSLAMATARYATC